VCRRDGDRVRVFSRKAKDWTGKPPVIVEAMRVLPVKSATLDGEGETICALGAERIVAKRRDRPYRSGRSPDWVKIKNSDAPAAGMRSHRKWRVVGCCAWWWREGGCGSVNRFTF